MSIFIISWTETLLQPPYPFQITGLSQSTQEMLFLLVSFEHPNVFLRNFRPVSIQTKKKKRRLKPTGLLAQLRERRSLGEDREVSLLCREIHPQTFGLPKSTMGISVKGHFLLPSITLTCSIQRETDSKWLLCDMLNFRKWKEFKAVASTEGTQSHCLSLSVFLLRHLFFSD